MIILSKLGKTLAARVKAQIAAEGPDFDTQLEQERYIEETLAYTTPAELLEMISEALEEQP